jgi:hypothetical protein
VVASLRDVVDDQDADLVGHRAVQGLWVAGDFMDSMVLVWRMRFVLSRSEAGRRARDRLVRAPVAWVRVAGRGDPPRGLGYGAFCSGRTASMTSGGRTP